MKTLGPRTRFIPQAIPALLLALTAVACGDDKQAPPPATAHEAAATPPPPAAPAPPPPQSTNVSIAQDILKACGIPAADAYFPFDSSKVTGKDRSPLDSVATCFTKGPLAGRGVKLVGHADPRGTSDYNMTLGQSRADSVAVYLEAKGVSAAKTSSSSRGAMDATGTDERGWEKDRRVDVLLSD